MKINKILLLLGILAMPVSGCAGSDDFTSTDYSASQLIDDYKYDIYTLYVSNGGTMSYEEWLESIRGEAGSSILNGVGTPPASKGKNNDIYVDTSNWDVYFKENDSWRKVGNIKGPKGDAGSQGEKGDAGAQGPKGDTGATGPQGDQGLSAYEIFIKYHPDYQGNEETWINDIALGNKCNLFGHDFEEVIVPSTCLEKGVKKNVCTFCSYEVVVEYLPLADHTITEVGTCSVCGYNYYLDVAETDVITVHGLNEGEISEWEVKYYDNYAWCTRYIGDGTYIKFPTEYKGIKLNYDYCYIPYGDIKNTCRTFWVPDGVEYHTIPERIFQYSTSIEKIILGDGVTDVGAYIVTDAPTLKYMSLGKNIQNIGHTSWFPDSLCGLAVRVSLDELDYRCKNLKFDQTENTPIFTECRIKKMTIADAVVSLPKMMFPICFDESQRNVIESIEFGYNSSLSVINARCFMDVTSLTSIYLPITLNHICEYAFENTNFETVFYHGSPDDWALIQIDLGNSDLKEENIKYYSEENNLPGLYWHFVDGVPTIW